jgi:two-component system sensor histidine kinase DesK
MEAVDHKAASPAERPTSRLAAWWSRATAGIRNRNARGWYFGASFGLIYQIIMLVSIWSSPLGLGSRILATALLVPFYAGFMFLPPMTWVESTTVRLFVIAAYWAYAVIFFFVIGDIAFWLWILVGAIAATIAEEPVIVAAFVAALTAGPLIYCLFVGFENPVVIAAPVIFSVAAMMFGISRQVVAIRRLKDAQAEMARLAVVDERARFSRDMHDVLGHSLTVVTVKSELARRLVSIDPARAEEEIGDIERLSRAALSDLRAAVSGYREMSVTSELGAANAALAAADIEPHLPSGSGAAASELTEIFGWVLREAVTNVIRHSDAHNCWVQITRTELTVDDDGRGLPAAGTAVLRQHGTGLLGLQERAQQVGAQLDVSPSDRGGVRVSVRKADA